MEVRHAMPRGIRVGTQERATLTMWSQDRDTTVYSPLIIARRLAEGAPEIKGGSRLDEIARPGSACQSGLDRVGSAL